MTQNSTSSLLLLLYWAMYFAISWSLLETEWQWVLHLLCEWWVHLSVWVLYAETERQQDWCTLLHSTAGVAYDNAHVACKYHDMHLLDAQM